jgi:hypothetical protein
VGNPGTHTLSCHGRGWDGVTTGRSHILFDVCIDSADIVEPDVQTTISVTDRVYVLDYGKVVLRGTTLELDSRGDIKKLHMGV